jgi:hypothetical protein
MLPLDYHRFTNSEFVRLVEDSEHDDPTGAAKGLDIPFRDKSPRAVRLWFFLFSSDVLINRAESILIL